MYWEGVGVTYLLEQGLFIGGVGETGLPYLLEQQALCIGRNGG